MKYQEGKKKREKIADCKVDGDDDNNKCNDGNDNNNNNT